jgi:hypothetical protein
MTENHPIFIFTFGKSGTGKSHKCSEWFNNKVTSLTPPYGAKEYKYLKSENIKVIRSFIDPDKKFRSTFFDKYHHENIKFVYFESFYSIEDLKQNIISEDKFDFIIEFNGSFKLKKYKEQYKFLKGNEEELKELIRRYI